MRHSIDSRPIKQQLLFSYNANNSYHVDTAMIRCRNLKCAYEDKNLKLVYLHQRLWILTTHQTHPHHKATVVYEIQSTSDCE